VQSEDCVLLFVIAWTITEIIRYSFYTFSLLNHLPYIIKWARLSVKTVGPLTSGSSIMMPILPLQFGYTQDPKLKSPDQVKRKHFVDKKTAAKGRGSPQKRTSAHIFPDVEFTGCCTLVEMMTRMFWRDSTNRLI
ncbi:hypothetical protein STEG23_036947, partial [Scotinomys teguina]